MSSDESDTPVGRPKKLRRVRLPWISVKLTNLFEAIDSYSYAREEGIGTGRVKRCRGAHALPRDYAARKDSLREPRPGLPRDFYDQTWLRAASRMTQESLQMRPEGTIPVPTLVGINCIPLLCLLTFSQAEEGYLKLAVQRNFPACLSYKGIYSFFLLSY